jgi:hypothetical protein
MVRYVRGSMTFAIDVVPRFDYLALIDAALTLDRQLDARPAPHAP